MINIIHHYEHLKACIADELLDVGISEPCTGRSYKLFFFNGGDFLLMD